MSEKNALAILGSPHTNGTTAAMLNFAVHKAEQAGYVVTKIILYEKKLSFCTGCRACMDTHICIQKDDIQEIAPLLHKSRLVILAAPVYWANVPAPVKNLFDRLLGNGYGRNRYISKTTLTGEAIYDFDFLQYPRTFFVDIRTEQRGDSQYGRIFQDRRHETGGKSGMCKCKE